MKVHCLLETQYIGTIEVQYLMHEVPAKNPVIIPVFRSPASDIETHDIQTEAGIGPRIGLTTWRSDPGSDTGLSLNIMSFTISDAGQRKTGIITGFFAGTSYMRYSTCIVPMYWVSRRQWTFKLPHSEDASRLCNSGQRRPGRQRRNARSIFFNETRFLLSEEGTFWLSDTPDVQVQKGGEISCPNLQPGWSQ